MSNRHINLTIKFDSDADSIYVNRSCWTKPRSHFGVRAHVPGLTLTGGGISEWAGTLPLPLPAVETLAA